MKQNGEAVFFTQLIDGLPKRLVRFTLDDDLFRMDRVLAGEPEDGLDRLNEPGEKYSFPFYSIFSGSSLLYNE